MGEWRRVWCGSKRDFVNGSEWLNRWIIFEVVAL